MFFFSFFQGVLAFFAPCAVALLPGYLSNLLRRGNEGASKKKLLFRAITLGSLSMLGIAIVYAIGGLLLFTLASAIKAYIVYVVITMGVLIIILGGFMLAGKDVSLPVHGPNAKSKNAYLESFIFGIAYGVGAFGCLFPLFLLVVTQAVAAGAIGASYILAYILGMGVFMMLFYILAVFAREFLQKQLRKVLPYVTRFSGAVLILAGAYIIYYQSVLL